MKKNFIYISAILLFSFVSAVSFPFLEGLYDGDRVVVAGIYEGDDNIQLAITYGDFEGQLDTLYYPSISLLTLANIRYEHNSNTYSVASSRYVPDEKYQSSINIFDSDLNIIRTRNDSLDIISEYTSHCVDSLGNVYTIGLKGDDGGDANDMWVRKFDTNLDLVWERTYGTSGKNDYGKDIQIDDGYIIAIGEGIDDVSGTLDPYLRKLDMDNGDELMKINFGDPESFDGCQELLIDSNGDYIVTGENPVIPERLFQFITTRITKDGEVKQLKYHGSPVTNDAGFSIRETEFGYIIAGYSDVYTIDGIEKKAIAITVDKNLDYLDQYTYPKSDGHATDIVVTDNKMFAIGMAFLSDEKGILWDLTPIVSSVDEEGMNNHDSYFMNISHFKNYIDAKFSDTDYQIYNIIGEQLSINQIISQQLHGIFFIVTDSEIVKIYLER